MSTNYPTSTDTFPTAADLADDTLATKPHSTLHGNLGDSVAALEAKVGVDSSAVATSLDYKVAANTTAIALKAPLASPTFTGTPAAPTPAASDNSTKLATTAYVDTADALKAPLASPALTGNPTAPTQSAGNNSTRVATTAYVDTADALKANLASPTLTGTPAAPTAASGTNTTQLATTAFVETEAVLKYGGGGETVNTNASVTGATTIALSSGNIQNFTLTGNTTFTFPTATAGTSFTLIAAQDSTGSRTITWPSSSTLKWAGGTAPTISTGASKVDTFTFISANSVWYGYASGIDMR